MKSLFCLAAEIQRFCEDQNWNFCFIGGIALQAWGEPRLTRDIDISILAQFGHEFSVIDPLLQKYPARVSDARQFAMESRVLLLKSEIGIPIDVVLAGLPFEEEIAERAVPFPFLPETTLRVCSAEDLVIYKAFADRSRDWADVEGILVRQGADNLDWSHVESNLEPLAEIKEAPHILVKLREIRERINQKRNQ
ncbi:MAG: nucleotidyl transferase AbiEii/AbiGii toxin family protein [Desulfococcaceae bacterium]